MWKSWEDYDKNWMHFVYKLDHLFQSMRLSNENSSVTKAFHFSNLISTQEFFHSICTIQSHILKFHPFLTSLAIFMHLMIYFELNDLEIRKHYNWTQKRLKLGMVSSFDQHNMCAKVERITEKMALCVQTGPSLSKYKGFWGKLICYKDISFF